MARTAKVGYACAEGAAAADVGANKCMIRMYNTLQIITSLFNHTIGYWYVPTAKVFVVLVNPFIWYLLIKQHEQLLAYPLFAAVLAVLGALTVCLLYIFLLCLSETHTESTRLYAAFKRNRAERQRQVEEGLGVGGTVDPGIQGRVDRQHEVAS